MNVPMDADVIFTYYGETLTGIVIGKKGEDISVLVEGDEYTITENEIVSVKPYSP